MSSFAASRVRWAQIAFMFAAGVPVASTMVGCPANSCFFQVCQGKQCRCSISSCQDGAEYNLKKKRCQCSAGHFDVAGQCLTQAAANDYCGKGHAWLQTPGARGGCVKLQCRPGDTLDEASGLCIPRDQVAASAGVQLGAGQTLGCAAGETLIVNEGQAACVPASTACAKDELWTGSACAKTAACETGEAFDPALGRCVAYASGGESEFIVNVDQWTFTTFGPPGGPGSPSFCAELAKKPYAFGLSPGASTLIRVNVQLEFPSGSVGAATSTVAVAYEVSGNPVPATGQAVTQEAATRSLQTLKAGGGKASKAAAATQVRCSIQNGNRPTSVPEEVGGF